MEVGAGVGEGGAWKGREMQGKSKETRLGRTNKRVKAGEGRRRL